jgi:hypothetical protein
MKEAPDMGENRCNTMVNSLDEEIMVPLALLRHSRSYMHLTSSLDHHMRTLMRRRRGFAAATARGSPHPSNQALT